MKKQIIVHSAVITMLAGIIIVYSWVIRPWQLTWGATSEEVASILPGDEYLTSPNYYATRAITINTAAEKIWPWLIQMGDKRGGWYTYDFFENRGIPSVKKIIPKYQHIALGDKVSMAFWVKDFRKDKWILLEGNGEQGKITWLMLLNPIDKNNTRFITRLRIQRYNSKLIERLGHLVFDAGEMFMTRKSMLGLKKRAEGLLGNLTETGSKTIIMNFNNWLKEK